MLPSATCRASGWRPHHHRHSGIIAFGGGFRVVGNSARTHFTARDSATSPTVMSSWLARTHRHRRRTPRRHPVPLSVARLKRFHPGAMVLKLRVRHAVLALKISMSCFMSRNWRWPGVWSIRLTIRSAAPCGNCRAHRPAFPNRSRREDGYGGRSSAGRPRADCPAPRRPRGHKAHRHCGPLK